MPRHCKNPLKIGWGPAAFFRRRPAPTGCTLAVTAAVLLMVVLFRFGDMLFPLPLEKTSFAAVVVADDGTPLRSFADEDGIWRYPIALEDVSPLYLQALMGFEDRWFRYHPGVNPLSIARAAWQNLRAGRVVSGGSTLTMQVARLLDPHRRSVFGKLKQVWRALQLEWHWSKDEILTYYINHAPYGGTIQGVQAAAYTYLGKSARELSHAEAALLAVLPQAPSRLRPDRAPQAAAGGRDKVLARMAALGLWPEAVVADARQEIVLTERYSAPMDCPLLARRLHGQSPQDTLIQTFIDPRLQYHLAGLAGQYAFRLPENNSIAILVLENATLAVKAYVGSADFADSERFGQVDMITAVRSPGSTLKPFLYGLALDAGLIHSQSLLTDAPRLVGPYRPGNFSDGFAGPVSATTALQRSLNVPAVQLLEAYGPQTLTDRLRNAGLTLVFPSAEDANLAMILGGVGTNLESLVAGYAALARGGLTGWPRYRRDDPIRERFLLSPGAAWIVRDMLRHPFSGQGLLHLVQQRASFAWKTGTSYGFRDAWAMAVNNAYTVGVWIGRPDGTPSPGQYGSATALPLLQQVLELLDLEADELPRPGSVTEADICWPTGWSKQQCDEQGVTCFRELKAWLLNGQAPPTLSDPHSSATGVVHTVMVNPATGLRMDRFCGNGDARPLRLALWPKALEPWLPAHWRRSQLIPPPDITCAHMPAVPGDAMKIAGITQDAKLMATSDRSAPPAITLETLGGIGQKTWYLNGRPIAVTRDWHAQNHQFARPGRYQLAVVDEAGNTDQVTFEVLSAIDR